MNELPTSSHKESETISIAESSTSKTRDQITIIAPISSKKRCVESRKRSCGNMHSEILTASPQRQKL